MRVEGLGSRVSELGFRVSGLGSMVIPRKFETSIVVLNPKLKITIIKP